MARTKRRGLVPLIIVGVLAVLLVVAYFLVDGGLRAFAQDTAEKEITKSMPASVTGDVTVTIGGTSVIAQFIAGSFDQVELTAPSLTVDGVPASVHVVARDVSTNTAKAIGSLTATLDVDQAALNQLVQASGTAPADAVMALGAGVVTYTGTVKLFEFNVGYSATATATAAGDTVNIAPTEATVTSGVGDIDATPLVNLILQQAPISVCVAGYLPEGVELNGVDISPERARVTLESSTLMLTRQSLTTLGTCSG
ncbi:MULTISPECIES: DUF2993 domain-containing protein [unclassified Cryobacterium]|uniref:LmeA family phospholipid-binding protein n=1 Tax=unclassified Cryobacterium TaxID=2649013 RepID=UPI00106D538A|nr:MULTISPECIES: DUF2993 domain-containing protein [unclassified Cryobacterium]TFD05613.1 DUF2993 domain-containing protein [Cryobacterium sp. TMT1-66-1]TFD08799.1 DUF2993 domain-containing protein [Cryobacterium sp. TMT1-2-2]